MADEQQPMSAEQLAEIRQRTLGGTGDYPAGTDMQIVFDRHRLLVEVERLRARQLDDATARFLENRIDAMTKERQELDAEIECLRDEVERLRAANVN